MMIWQVNLKKSFIDLIAVHFLRHLQKIQPLLEEKQPEADQKQILIKQPQHETQNQNNLPQLQTIRPQIITIMKIQIATVDNLR